MSGLLDPRPLLDLIDRRARDQGVQARQFIRERDFTTQRQLPRWRNGERVTSLTVDRICHALGVHPVEIYGDDWTGTHQTPPPIQEHAHGQ